MKAKSQLIEMVEKRLRENCGALPGERLLVAVSGGVDSMVLLHLLAQGAQHHAWVLGVAHLNHGLRGRASDADERLVRRTAAALGLECICERVKAGQLRQAGSISLEMAAREARHRFLLRAASQFKTTKVVLAHHADDQAELFFVRLLRGSGSDGLAGMEWNGGSPFDARVRLLRPLLECSKSEIQAYAQAEQLQHREDESNQDLDMERNWVRHELLPIMLARRPALPAILPRIMETLRAESDFLEFLARAWMTEAGPSSVRQPFSALHPALQRTCLRLQLPALNVFPEFDLIEKLRTKPGKMMIAPGNIAVVCSADGRVTVVPKTHQELFTDAQQFVPLTRKGGRIEFGGLQLQWKPGKGTVPVGKPPTGTEYFDAEKLEGGIMLRYWRAGDRFQPIGMSHPVKLQDLFTNEKVPRAARHQRVVGMTAPGEIFWVEGLRIGERFKLDKETRLWLKWGWQRIASAG
ncbi:MAG: tRNA lysidine(34) synthetase TilS [Verrucomicrobiota bacterium]